MATNRDVIAELSALKNPAKAKVLAGYFKTGKGEYGDGDVFLGITVPEQRLVAKKFKDLELSEIAALLSTSVHEYRFTALEILVMKYEKGDNELKKEIVNFYLSNTAFINNWDLVDTSARYILGDYLFDKPKERAILYRLVTSNNLWERRIAIVATHDFIAKGEFKDTFKIAELLLDDPHDLIHKSTGWMLREVGNKSVTALEEFLIKFHRRMPRTMLRYALERFSKEKRVVYMGK